MDRGRYYDLRQIQNQLKTEKSRKRINMLQRSKASILKQLKDPELQELRRKMLWAQNTGRESLREACEKRMRRIQ